MRWVSDSAAKCQWRRWFAWHPVKTSDTEEWVWLEPVLRRWHRGADCWEYEDPL